VAAAADTTRTRKSAEERRAEIVRIAVEHFALGGYNGTSTEAIARDAGISQPYLFRLFKTKRDLFLACHGWVHARLHATFADAGAAGPREEALERMGRAYLDLLEDRHALLFQMQSYAACADPVIQEQVRARYGELVALVTRVSGAPPEAVWQFFSHGMLLNVIASLDLRAISGQEEWAGLWCAPGEMIRQARDLAA
jgi:AcrR family transcriptional regulator